VLRGVLFDLDGTLLDIKLGPFFREYFAALGPVVADVLGNGDNVTAGLDAVLGATEAMSLPHATQTNQVVFNERFHELTGADLDLEEYAVVFERFYAEIFPSLRGGIGPLPGARRAVETALDLGLRVAIATNPIFPRSAIEERMRWAGVHDLPVHVVTSYETMHAAKPHPSYFLETAAMLGVKARESVMVGDDRVLDMTAADVGMRTFYVGDDIPAACDWNGTLDELTELLPRIASRKS
jgi:FMN phosphatase YigB (HAD superfamily)